MEKIELGIYQGCCKNEMKKSVEKVSYQLQPWSNGSSVHLYKSTDIAVP